MKKIIFILVGCFALIDISYADSLELPNTTNNKSIERTQIDFLKNYDVDFEESLYKIEISECMLSAELSYQGVAIKFSITEETCEAAGRGIAQAMKGFFNEAFGQK